MKNSLDLSIRAKISGTSVPFLRRMLRSAHRLLKCPLRELSVALVGDAEMKRLHRRFKGVAHPTDVLAFELDHDRRGRVTAGEIVVCVPQARRQARVGVRREVLLCALHGMLHLCGLEDKTRRGFAAMHRAEDRLLKRLGVGAVFAPLNHRAGA
jgi:probable rRNA maturation factor